MNFSSNKKSTLNQNRQGAGKGKSGKRKAKVTAKKPKMPQAGGTMKGLGEQFKQNGFTGTAQLDVGELDYHSGGGNGPWGMGFSYENDSGISRRVSHGTPTYDDSVDQFLWNGDILVPVTGSDGKNIIHSGYFEEFDDGWKTARISETKGDYLVRIYRKRDETDFEKIQYWTQKDSIDPELELQSFWRIITPENEELVCGADKAAQIYNPNNPSHVFKWLLQESLEADGQDEYTKYLDENTDNVDVNLPSEKNRVQTAQKYLDRISHGHPYPIPAPLSYLSETGRKEKEPEWYFETVFGYGQYDISPGNLDPYQVPIGNTWSCRADSFSDFTPGFEIRTHRLCIQIMEFHLFTELSPNPILTQVFSLNYRESPICSQLITLDEIGYYWRDDAYQVEYGIPVELDYTEFNPLDQFFRPILESGTGMAFPSIGGEMQFVPVDLYGRGIEGFLFSDGFSDYYMQATWDSISDNTPGSPLIFETQQIDMPLPMERLETGSEHLFTDINGNGKLDYLVNIPNQVGYYETDIKEKWTGFQPLNTYPLEEFNPEHNFFDITGDSLPDIVMFLGNGIRFYENLEGTGFNIGENINRSFQPMDFPNSIDTSEAMVFQNTGMAGDGKEHLVKITHNKCTYWPNYSYGAYGGSVEMDNFPQISYNEFRDDRVLFADINGTGTSDFILLRSDRISVYLNQSGNSFSDEIALPLPDGEDYDPLDNIFFSDVLGNGIPALIYNKTHPEPAQWMYDFSDGIKPYLLNSIVNNHGGRYQVSYISSVHYYLADQENGIEWLTVAPMSIQVVSEIMETDEISGSVEIESYNYRHSYYDGTEREFRGFGYVGHQDSMTFNRDQDQFDSPPTLTKTWYHTGSPNQGILTKQFEEEYYQGDPLAQNLPDSVIDFNGFEYVDTEEIQREAEIALNGTLLRTEIYGLDGSALEDVPYTTEESNALIVLLQPKYNNYYASMLLLDREELVYDYERNPSDPKTEYEASLQYDEYGHLLQNCEINYGRRKSQISGLSAQKEIEKEQTTLRVFSEVTLFHNLTDPVLQIGADANNDELYYLGIPYDDKEFLIVNIEKTGTLSEGEIYSFDQLSNFLAVRKPDNINVPFSLDTIYDLTEWNKDFYLYPISGNSEKLPSLSVQVNTIGLERSGPTAFILENYSELANFKQDELLDDNLLGDFFEADQLDELMLYTGHYISGNGYWWTKADHLEYFDSSRFYLPQYFIDENGNQTVYGYDSYNLLMISSTDAVGNQVLVENMDYQTLEPIRISDINLNIYEVFVDPLHRVIAESYYGGEMQSDGNNEVYNPDVGFYSLYNADGKDSAYNIEPANSIGDILDQPFKFLQNASEFTWYDNFSQMGQVTQEDYVFAIPGIDLDLLDNWWNGLLDVVFINPSGAIYWYFRKILNSSIDIYGFREALEAVSSSLEESFAAFPMNQQQEILDLLQAAILPPETIPIHHLELTAQDYPYLTQAMVTQTDYTEYIPDINTGDLNIWWQEQIDNNLISSQGLFTTSYRPIVQEAEDIESFQASLAKISSDLENAFAAFGTETENEILALLKNGLYERITEEIGYYDGFGRDLQTKIRAENGTDCWLYNPETGNVTVNTDNTEILDRWLSSGNVVYNNKGEKVREYEPYYIDTTQFVSDRQLENLGSSPTFYFDAMDRINYEFTDKGFLLWNLYTAWQQEEWDANDTILYSPYYLVNEKNINEGDTDPPEPGSKYYEYRQYFDPDMTDSDRLAIQESIVSGWTPEIEIEDNRDLVLINCKGTEARVSKNSFTAIGYDFEMSTLLYEDLVRNSYLRVFSGFETKSDRKIRSGIQNKIKWATFTSEFPFPVIYLSGEYMIRMPSILDILFSYKSSESPVPSDVFVEIGFNSLESPALRDELVEMKILNGEYKVTDKLKYPRLELLSEVFRADSDKIVSYLVKLWAAGNQLNSYFTFDLQGREKTLADPRLHIEDKINIEIFYPETMGEALHFQNCDAGGFWFLKDALGLPIWGRDPRGYVHTVDYDGDNRPVVFYTAYQVAGQYTFAAGLVAVQIIQYGENIENANNWNYRGQAVQNFDQSSWSGIINGYNILGLPLGGQLYLTKPYEDSANNPMIPPMPLVDVPALLDIVEPPATSLLQSIPYYDSGDYDAIGRAITSIDAADNVHYYRYFRSGLLQQKQINGVKYIDGLIYNARGLRVQQECYNGDSGLVFTTLQTFDKWNYRLLQIYSTTDPSAISRENEFELITYKDENTRQNLIYSFSPEGNITSANGYYQGTLDVEGNEYPFQEFIVEENYLYDAIYRLVGATGLKYIEDQSLQIMLPYPYQRNYGYDDGNNLTLMQDYDQEARQPAQTTLMHTAPSSNRAIDNQLYDTLTPQQKRDLDQALIEAGLFDVHGNQLITDAATNISWSFQEQVLSVQQINGTETLNYYFVYDSHRKRVRKISETLDEDGNRSQLSVVVYLGNLEFRDDYVGNTLQYDGENVTTKNGKPVDPLTAYSSLRIRDMHRQLARLDHYTYQRGSETDFYEEAFFLDNNIDSCQMVLDGNGKIASYETYYPYGGTVFTYGDISNQHYKYSGQEKDATGFYYYGMRYYSASIFRWLSIDPSGFSEGLNLYAMLNGNPVTFRDEDGLGDPKNGKSPRRSNRLAGKDIHGNFKKKLKISKRKNKKKKSKKWTKKVKPKKSRLNKKNLNTHNFLTSSEPSIKRNFDSSTLSSNSISKSTIGRLFKNKSSKRIKEGWQTNRRYFKRKNPRINSPLGLRYLRNRLYLKKKDKTKSASNNTMALFHNKKTKTRFMVMFTSGSGTTAYSKRYNIHLFLRPRKTMKNAHAEMIGLALILNKLSLTSHKNALKGYSISVDKDCCSKCAGILKDTGATVRHGNHKQLAKNFKGEATSTWVHYSKIKISQQMKNQFSNLNI